MRKKILMLAVTALVAASVTGCGEDTGVVDNITESITEAITEEVTEEKTELTTEQEKIADEATEAIMDEIKKITEEASATDGALPKFTYTGQDKMYDAIYKYISDEIGKNYDKGDVEIPNPMIVEIDESDSSDIKVWGDFWYDVYKVVDGDTLESQAGGSYPGLMHLSKDENGDYTVKSFDVVADGSDNDESAKEIFGDKYDAYISLKDDKEAYDKNRNDIISGYVMENKLSITKFKDYGWDPIELNLDK
jgi:hypothetical protein